MTSNGEHHSSHIYTNYDRRRRYYMPTSSMSTSFKGCCCCLFLLVTFLALLGLALALILVLVVKPKKPQFQLKQTVISYLLITRPTNPLPSTSAAYLSMNISMVFSAQNPNKVGIKYQPTRLYVMYRGVPLGTGSIPGFEQPAHTTRLVETHLAVSRVNVLQADAVKLIKDAVVDDRIKLRILGDVGAKIRVLSLTSPKVEVPI